MAWKFAGKFDSERVEDDSGRVIGRFSGHSHHASVTLEYGGTTFKYPPREDSVCTIEEAEAFVRGVEAAFQRSNDAILDARINASKNQLYPAGSNWVLLRPRS